MGWQKVLAWVGMKLLEAAFDEFQKKQAKQEPAVPPAPDRRPYGKQVKPGVK